MKSLMCVTRVTLLAVLIAACGAAPAQSVAGATTTSAAMKPAVTYLFLLRFTPFFKHLSTAQLRSVIEHSHEWNAQAGTVVAECANDARGAESTPGIWILLHGGWQVEHAGRSYPADAASAGKWFSADVTSDACRLVTNEHSYVMKIERADFAAMLAQGFSFDADLDAGRRYYAELFGTAAASPAMNASAPTAATHAP